METFESEHSFMKKSKSRYTNYYLLGGGFQDQPGCSVQTSGRVSFQTRALPSPSCQYYTVLPSDPRRPSGFIVGSYNCSFAAYLKVPTFWLDRFSISIYICWELELLSPSFLLGGENFQGWPIILLTWKQGCGKRVRSFFDQIPTFKKKLKQDETRNKRFPEN